MIFLVRELEFFTGHKCREEWPSKSSEQVFNLFLDAMLLLIPVLIMSLAYSLIMSKLWKGLRREIQHNTSFQQQSEYISICYKCIVKYGGVFF